MAENVAGQRAAYTINEAMTLNPDILTWARDTAGLSADEAARALGFNETRSRSAVQRLIALETGQEEPSRSVLLKMSQAYRRPLLVFYLARPPRIGDRGRDFRTVPGAPPPQYNPILDALLRDIRGRQAVVRALHEDDQLPPVDFVGTGSIDDSVQDLAKRIAERLGFSLEDFRRRPNVEQSFKYLREKIEAVGVYVLLLGNLGSHHTNISVETFRGFAIADAVAPFIVINDQDARPAWAFTAIHELAHLWLGATGVSGASLDAAIEKYCNDVASEILLPAAEIEVMSELRRAPIGQLIEAVSDFAKMRKISRAMVAYKLFRAHIINESIWRQLMSRFQDEWIASRSRRGEADTAGGGPSYYVLKRHRLGEALLGFVKRSLAEGTLTHTKAAQVLGVKPRNVDPLLSTTPGRNGH